MKVKELIEVLSTMEQDADIYIKDWGTEDNEYYEIRKVLHSSKSNHDGLPEGFVEIIQGSDLIEIEED